MTEYEEFIALPDPSKEWDSAWQYLESAATDWDLYVDPATGPEPMEEGKVGRPRIKATALFGIWWAVRSCAWDHECSIREAISRMASSECIILPTGERLLSQKPEDYLTRYYKLANQIVRDCPLLEEFSTPTI